MFDVITFKYFVDNQDDHTYKIFPSQVSEVQHFPLKLKLIKKKGLKENHA